MRNTLNKLNNRLNKILVDRINTIYASGFFMGSSGMIYHCYRVDDMDPIFTSYAAIISGVIWPISIPILFLCSKQYRPLN